jgi:hypothetical protein
MRMTPSQKSISITVNVGDHGAQPQLARQSAGQIALAVRRAIERAERDM